MVISRLEVIGFKSFAQRTVLLFPEGLTAIVGPNGCGKSNLVDALRWVLGEQRLSVLRCETLEQLIFNGSRAQKPLGMAEVSLTVENTGGILPVEFSQVVVTRRVYRSGESEYRLNGTPCRLRDIQELFLDTGLAPHGYSVIELRMVEELLNGRPEERRRLIEEAAGIGRYKLRHREAQRKLEHVQHDLARLEDLLAELRQRAAALHEQAAQTRRWHTLQQERTDIERLLAAVHYRQLWKQLQQVEGQIEEYHCTVEHLTLQAKSLREELSAVETRRAELQQQLHRYADQERQLNEQLHTLRLRYTAIEERLCASSDAVERLRRDSERLDGELTRLRQEREGLQQQYAELQQRCNVLAQNYHAAHHRVEELRQQLHHWRQQLSPRQQYVEQRRQALFQQRVEYERLHTRLDFLTRQGEQLGAELERLQQRRRELDSTSGQLQAQLDEYSQRRERLRLELHQRHRQLEQLNEQLRQLRQHREHLQRESMALRAQREWLEGLVNEHSFLQALRRLLPEAELALVAEYADVPEELRKAFTAAVGALAEIPILTAGPEQLESWLGRVRSVAPTGALFVPWPLQRAPAAFRPPPSARGWLWEMVELPDRVATVLQTLIGNVAVVDSLTVSGELFEQGYTDAVVTPEGVFLHRCGLLRWTDGAAQAPWIGRRRTLERVARQLEDIEQEIQRCEAAEAELRSQQEALDPEPLRLALADTERILHSLRVRIEQLTAQAQEVAHAEQERAQHWQRLQAEQAAVAERLQHLEAHLGTMQQELETLSEELATALRTEEQLRMELEAAEQQWRSSEREWLALQHTLERVQQKVQELSRQIEQQEQRQQQRAAERVAAVALYEQLSQQRETLAEELAKLEQQWEQLQRNYEHERQQEQSLSERYTTLRRQLEEVQQQLDASQRRLHEAELRREQLRGQLHSAAEHFRERFAAEPSQIELPTPLPSIGQLQQRLRAVAEQLEALGAVNFRALQEYEELLERLRLLEAQYADLQQAAHSLDRIIEETHRVALQRFVKTFEQVRQNFQRLFRVLFAEGDEADLRLGEGTPLEAPIEIVAKPRGKRPQLLEQLSGGEKTLVVLAFLFALYLVKPSPFCVLDEVDAPLDDANIDRFLRLLRSFGQTTQFVLVTHNKRTMEAVDTLYGVTMQPEGVSKVFALRLRSGELVQEGEAP